MTAVLYVRMAFLFLLGVFSCLLYGTRSAQAEDDLLEGVFSFVCGGEGVVFLETEAGWQSPGMASYEVTKTNRGWRMEDRFNGSVAYLQREKGDGAWIVNYLGEVGFEHIPCQDLGEVLSITVNLIKGKLSENISRTQAELEIAQQELHQLSLTHLEKMEALENAEKEIQRLSDSLESTRLELDSIEADYLEFWRLAAGGGLPQVRKHFEDLAGDYLERVANLPSVERYNEINGGVLSAGDVPKQEELRICVKLLKDKQQLDADCKTRLVELLVVSGLE